MSASYLYLNQSLAQKLNWHYVVGNSIFSWKIIILLHQQLLIFQNSKLFLCFLNHLRFFYIYFVWDQSQS